MEEDNEKNIFIFGGFEPLTKKKKKKPINRDLIITKKRDKEEEEEEKKEEPKKKLQIKSLHDYAIEKEKLLEIPTGTHEQLPSMKDVLSYVSRLEVRPFWFKSSQENIINSNALKMMTMDVLTRGYIKPFLKSGPYPCRNIRCESERMGGFRIRILQMPGKNDGVWCFLCHLYETNKLYFESLNRSDEKKDLNYQIHYFMVQVDVPGEYRLDRTLDNEKDVRGLRGPFPIYNVNNYRRLGLQQEWIESDAMVFRPTQTMSSSLIESCSTTKKGKANSYFQIVNDSQKLYLESQQ